jgi:hypothetical protein
MQRRLAQIDESIARYLLSQLDSADRQREAVPEAKITGQRKIATLRQEIQRLNALNAQMMQTEHEAVLKAVQARVDRNPAKMRLRRQTVEHPFGTIKSWMGSTHFQMKTLKHVGTEMALHALAYNMKRVMSKFRRELRKQRLRTVDQRKGRKTDHEKGETNSRHRERRVSAPSPHLIRRALSPRLANGLAGKTVLTLIRPQVDLAI